MAGSAPGDDIILDRRRRLIKGLGVGWGQNAVDLGAAGARQALTDRGALLGG